MSTLQKIKLGKALANEDTFATCLVAILLKEFDTEFFDWEPETLELEIGAAFPGVDVPDVNMDKIGALVTALTTDQFYLYFEIYSNVCRSLNGEEADFANMAMPTPRELAWGVTEVRLSDIDENGKVDMTFSNEVANFTGFILEEHGVYKKPKALDFAEYPRPNPVLTGDDTFASDVDMFQAAMKSQQVNADDIDSYVNEKAVALMQQLKELDLITSTPTPNRQA